MAVVTAPISWHALTVPETLRLTHARREGLRDAEARVRLERNGPNSLPEPKRRSLLVILWKQFASTLVVILLGAAGVSAVLGRFIDVQVILFAVLISVVFGFLQESRAEEAISSLRSMVVATARVRRDNSPRRIPTREIAMGDIVELTVGESVPADGRVVRASTLEISEAALTGESAPVSKQVREVRRDAPLAERSSMLYRGSLVVSGSGEMAVTAVGAATEVGAIATSLATIGEEKTPLEKQLAVFSSTLVRIILVVTTLIFLFGIALGRPLIEMFLLSVAIAVAAIPEGMVVGVTATLAVGMRRILKARGLVRSLLSAETLGSTSVVCVDKTGTLTEGNMALADVIPAFRVLEQDTKVRKERERIREDEEAVRLLSLAMLSSDAVVEVSHEAGAKPVIHGVPTERGIVETAYALGLRKKDLVERFGARVDTRPFDPDRKYLVTLEEGDKNGRLVIIRGAPEPILELCSWYDERGAKKPLKDEERKRFLDSVSSLAGEGYRVTACAQMQVPRTVARIADIEPIKPDLVLLGFLPLRDEIRKKVPAAIRDAHQAGVRILMITGDHPATARAIGQEVGLLDEHSAVMTGADIDRSSPTEFTQLVEKTGAFARTSASHKLKIVEALQAHGEVVAMTGDGVNDAPALKKADIGIAVGSGTDVAKETADLVLLDNDFSTIVRAIFEGRIIYANVRKMVLYLLSDSFSEGVLIVASILFGLPLPLVAAQILWINLVTDGFPGLALTVDSESHNDRIRTRPTSRHASILDSRAKVLIISLSAVTGLAALGMFAFDLSRGNSLAHAQSLIFTLLAVDSLFYVFSIRSIDRPVWTVNPFSNRWLLIAVLSAFLLQLSALHLPAIRALLGTVPLSVGDWGVVGVWGVGVMVITELVKRAFTLAQPAKTR